MFRWFSQLYKKYGKNSWNHPTAYIYPARMQIKQMVLDFLFIIITYIKYKQ